MSRVVDTEYVTRGAIKKITNHMKIQQLRCFIKCKMFHFFIIDTVNYYFSSWLVSLIFLKLVKSYLYAN